MIKAEILQQTRLFVKESLQKAEAGHDWWHIKRVTALAMDMARETAADVFVTEMACLLHDIGDAKFHDGNESIGPALIKNFLQTQAIDKETVDKIMFIIEHMSFRKSDSFFGEKSIEFQVVQDADRLDSIGAIGIARAFSFGGYKGRPFYNPEKEAPTAAYQSGQSATINHFYEKLLKLKDLMNTESGKKRAEVRHAFMLQFLDQFYLEWDGKV